MPPTIPCREVNSLTISVARSTLPSRAAGHPLRGGKPLARRGRQVRLERARGGARRLLLRSPAQPVADRGGERGQALGLLGVAAELLLEGQPLELLRPVREAGLAVLAVEE